MSDDDEERKVSRNKNMGYGHIAGLILVIGLLVSLYPFFSAPVGHFVYIYDYTATYNYTENFSINKNVVLPSGNLVPVLNAHFVKYSAHDVLNIASLFGMKEPNIIDYSAYYQATTSNATLNVSKAGYFILYGRTGLEPKAMNMSNGQIYNITRRYLHNLEPILPKGVSIGDYKVYGGRAFDENGTTIYYTKNISFGLTFAEYPLTINLTMELYANGALAGFYDVPVHIGYGGVYTEIGTFNDAYLFMKKSGIPITVAQWNISWVSVENVSMAFYLLSHNERALIPGYFVVIRLALVDGSYVDQKLFLGWEH